MRSFLTAIFCLILVVVIGLPCAAQTADTDPATKDDIILFFRTMRSHDMVQKIMEVQSKAMQQLFRDQLAQDKGVPTDFDKRWKKAMDGLIKGMPLDEMTQAMIPAYQNHFTHGDITAMNAFYASPVGQKVIQELPEVTQEGMKEMMPILSKYLSEWKDKLPQEFDDTKKAPKSLQD
jgi:uncharacterized protein